MVIVKGTNESGCLYGSFAKRQYVTTNTMTDELYHRWTILSRNVLDIVTGKHKRQPVIFRILSPTTKSIRKWKLPLGKDRNDDHDKTAMTTTIYRNFSRILFLYRWQIFVGTIWSCLSLLCSFCIFTRNHKAYQSIGGTVFFPPKHSGKFSSVIYLNNRSRSFSFLAGFTKSIFETTRLGRSGRVIFQGICIHDGELQINKKPKPWG